MDLGENIKKSFAYPLCDYNKFAMIGVLSVFSVLYSVCSSFAGDNPGVIVISVLISSIFFVYLMGFSVSVIECGINLKEKIPDFKVGRDISNFFKYLALSIVYGIVPGIIIFITILGSGILKIFTDISPYIQYGNTDIPPDLLSSFMFAFLIILLVTVVVTVIQSIFTNLGVARMAANNSFSDGLDFFEVFNDIGKIGWFKTVGWFIVICVLNMVFFMISMGIMMIPYVGVILAAFFMMTFMKLFNSYSVGLLYSDAYKISKTQEDIKEIPKAENISERRDVLDEYEEISKKDAGNEVKKISFPMRFINYCKGCLGCVSSGECVIHDDMSGILEDMVDAEVIVFASPIYFNTISGQMKTMIDRLTPKARQLNDKDYYFLFSTASDNQKSLEPAVCELRGFLNCIGVESEKGIVFGLNAESEGEINHNENALNQAFEFGKNI